MRTKTKVTYANTYKTITRTTPSGLTLEYRKTYPMSKKSDMLKIMVGDKKVCITGHQVRSLINLLNNAVEIN